jgi:CheY-like chemotaxis protein
MTKILLIDHSVEFRSVVKSILERDSHQVTVAEPDRMAASDFAIEGATPAFDLVIVDVEALSADGVEAIGRLKRANPRVRVLVLSGNRGPAAPNELPPAARELRATMMISRSFSVAELLGAVQNLLAMP